MVGQAGAGTITVSGSAELGSGSFSATRLSGEAVVLGVTPEAQWTSGGVKVNTAAVGTAEDDLYLRLAGNGAGGAFLAWQDRRDNRADVYGASVNSSGTPTELTIASAVGTQESPRVCQSVNSGTVDGNFVVWQNEHNNSIQAKKYLTSGTLDRDYSVCSEGSWVIQPDVASDQSGGAVFVWRDYRDGNAGAIYAVRLNALGTTPEATGWAANGIRLCSSETAAGATTEAREPRIVAMTNETGEKYMIVWKDSRDGYKTYYCQRVNQEGHVSTDFPLNGTPIVTSTTDKDNLDIKATMDHNGAAMVWDDEASGGDVYGQIVQGSANRWYGDSGRALGTGPGNQSSPSLAVLPGYGTAFGWIDVVSLNGYVQRLSAYGTPEWGAGGRLLSRPAIDLCHDGRDGLYLAAIGTGGAVYPLYVQRLDAAGNELWGSGVLATTRTIDDPDDLKGVKVIESEGDGLIVSWIGRSGGNKDVYVQKFRELYQSAGSYTSAPIENTDPTFEAWTTMSWSESALSGEVRTAASSAALDAATWESLSGGGAVASGGKWLQARFSLAAGAGRTTTPRLTGFSLGYSTAGTAPSSPEVGSVKVNGVELVSGDYVDGSPVIEIVAHDDARLASVAVELNDNPQAVTLVTTSETSWTVRSTPLVSVGSHTLKVTAANSGGRSASRSYTIQRSASSGVSGGVKALASGNSIVLAYELTGSARTRVEIRNILGTKVKEFFCDAGAAGGTAGYNEVSFDAGDLPIGPYIILVIPTGGAPVSGTFSIR